MANERDGLRTYFLDGRVGPRPALDPEAAVLAQSPESVAAFIGQSYYDEVVTATWLLEGKGGGVDEALVVLVSTDNSEEKNVRKVGLRLVEWGFEEGADVSVSVNGGEKSVVCVGASDVWWTEDIDLSAKKTGVN